MKDRLVSVVKDRHLCEWRDGEDRCADVCEYKLAIERSDGSIAMVSAHDADAIECTSIASFLEDYDSDGSLGEVSRVDLERFNLYLDGNYSVIGLDYAATYADMLDCIARSKVTITSDLRKHLEVVLKDIVTMLEDDAK